MSEKRQKSILPAVLFREKSVKKVGYIDDYIFACEVEGEDHIIYSKPRKPKYHLVIIVVEGYINMVINGEKFRFGKRTYINLPTWVDIYEIEYGGGFRAMTTATDKSVVEDIFRNRIPWSTVAEDPEYKPRALEFARWLLENKDNPNNPEGYRESGKFFWGLWMKGASFEAINWYRNKRNEFRTHSYFATEFPADDVECFMAAGNLVFDKYCVEAMQSKMKKAPVFVGNIIGDDDKGRRAIISARLIDRLDDGQALRVWQHPDCLKVKYRYVVSVDIGGRGRNSDFTVMTVIDRFPMMFGGRPKVVARWRGHIRHDLLAWKAAQLAHYYGDAELVIEKNTADTKKERIDEEGSHFGSIIDEIADYYPNLYIGRTEVDKVTQKITNVYGFHTNSLSKEQVIDNYIEYIEDELYEEPDEMAYRELFIYERKEDGTMGNVDGKDNHDDIVMSTGIGLYVSKKMPMPEWDVEETEEKQESHAGTEADI